MASLVKLQRACVSIVILLVNCVSMLESCEIPSEIVYPLPSNSIDSEIDDLLSCAVTSLYLGDFVGSLEAIRLAEANLQYANDPNDHRRLRVLFGKAMTTTCLEGFSKNSMSYFDQFENLLISKGCANEGLQVSTYEKKHWPIYGPEDMSTSECVKAVDNSLKVALIAAGKLPLETVIIFELEDKLLTIATKARQCCIQNGYWKNCLQPLIDAWQVMQECYRIPPEYCT